MILPQVRGSKMGIFKEQQFVLAQAAAWHRDTSPLPHDLVVRGTYGKRKKIQVVEKTKVTTNRASC